jgi:hypothetical protein
MECIGAWRQPLPVRLPPLTPARQTPGANFTQGVHWMNSPSTVHGICSRNTRVRVHRAGLLLWFECFLPWVLVEERGQPGAAGAASSYRRYKRSLSGLAPENATIPHVKRTDREQRLARATTRLIRPNTREAAELDAMDDAFWDQVPIDERLGLAFQLSVHQWRLHGWRTDRRGNGLSRSVTRVRRP